MSESTKKTVPPHSGAPGATALMTAGGSKNSTLKAQLQKERLIDACFRCLKLAWARASAATRGGPATRTLIVAGVQRSGTTMMMRILDRSWQTDVCQERDARAYRRNQLHDDATIRRLATDSHFPFLVIKALVDASRLRGLLDLLRPARAIWMIRDYNDVINSILAKWPGKRNEIDELVVEPARAGWRGWGMSPETLETVRKHYRPDINDATAHALFWYYRSQLYFDLNLRDHPEVLSVRYEDLVKAPDRWLETIASFTGLELNRAMRSVANDRSVGKRPSPPIEPAVRELCDAMMERLDRALAETAPTAAAAT